MKTLRINRIVSLARIRGALALFVSATMLAVSFLAAGVSGQQKTSVQSLGEEQRILHVLNRLGFGARPGDAARVREMGIDAYIRQQLNPASVTDTIAESKVANLETLSLTTAELYAKYPNPGVVLRQLQQQGKLPEDLAAVRDGRRNTAPPAASGSKDSDAMEGKDPAGGAATGAANAGQNPEADRNANRRAIRDYYVQNNLRPPQLILQELHASRILRAVYSERQLQEVMVDFWENHFNIFSGKGADRWLLISFDRDTVRPRTLGKFRDLLLATAQSPAMLFYLDNFQSSSPKASQADSRPFLRQQNQGNNPYGLFGRGGQRRVINDEMRRQQQTGGVAAQAQQRQTRGINENYARELMELHTLGVDGGYTQKDVQEVARCFTGWTIFAPRGGGGRMPAGMADNAGKAYFNARLHDDGEKIVLGQKIPAGGGAKDGMMVIDILSRHPSTARFLAEKLARRFVMDEPTPALIDRIAAAYTKSDGDIRETLRAIFSSPEFNSPAAYRAKIKTPFELAVSSLRTLGGDTNGGPSFHQWIARMGEALYGYQAPTGYPDTAEDWVNTGALLERLNFGLALANNRIPGTRVDLSRFASENGSADKEQVLNRFLEVIIHGDVSANTKRTLIKQLNEPLPEPTESGADSQTARDGGNRLGARRREIARADAGNVNSEVVKIVGLILGSPEFQRQ